MSHELTPQERKLMGGTGPALMPMSGQPVHINRDPKSAGSIERNVKRIERLKIAIAEANAKDEGHLMGDHRRELADRLERARR